MIGMTVCSGIGANAKDMTGLRLGRLLVLAASGKTNDGHIAWLCKCDCGKEKVISSHTLRRKKPVHSCGCLNYTVAQSRKLPGGPWNEGKSYSIANGEHVYKTRHSWAKAVIHHYGNKCQTCGWDKARCDAHHKILKSKGGQHTISNGKVQCPNCHRIEHEGASQ